MATKTAAKVTLHWLNGSRSQRVLWLLESCPSLSYDLKVYKRTPQKLAPTSLKEIHPLGKSPTITLTNPTISPEQPPLILAESGAIFEYITEYYGSHLVPTRYKPGLEKQPGGETEAWIRHKFYMHYAEGSFMMMLFISFIMDQLRNGPIPFFVKPLTRAIANNIDSAFLAQNLKTQFSFLESQLASSPKQGEYLCGDQLTAADILMSYPILAAKASGMFSAEKYGGKHPKLLAYAERLEKDEGHVKSIKIAEEATGEKYQLLP